MTIDFFLNQVIPSLERYIGNALPKDLSDIEKQEWQRIQKVYIKNKMYADLILKRDLEKEITNLSIDFCLLENFVPKKNDKGEFLFETALKRKQYYEKIDKFLNKDVNLSSVSFFVREDLKVLPFYNTAEFQYKFDQIIEQPVIQTKKK